MMNIRIITQNSYLLCLLSFAFYSLASPISRGDLISGLKFYINFYLFLYFVALLLSMKKILLIGMVLLALIVAGCVTTEKTISTTQPAVTVKKTTTTSDVLTKINTLEIT